MPTPQSLSHAPPGSILVNPWNINDVAAAIEDALSMSEEERRERHRQNYMHVATHTAQVR
jgi:trehalose 6-phosphate synthase/phosphatase